MPVAKLSDRAHEQAKESEQSIGDEVDRWMDCARVQDLIYVTSRGAGMLHKPDVTPHGHLTTKCQAPNDGEWLVVGPSQAEELVEEHGDKVCPHCTNDE